MPSRSIPCPISKLDLPRQNAREFKGLTSRNLNEHPLAGKRVRITLVAQDGANQEGRSPPVEIILPRAASTSLSPPPCGRASGLCPRYTPDAEVDRIERSTGRTPG